MHLSPVVSCRGRQQKQEPRRPQPQSQQPPAAVGATTAGAASPGPEHTVAPTTICRNSRTCRQPEDQCSRRGRQQQKEPHHILCRYRRGRCPPALTTSKTTRGLTSFLHRVPKELPRPDLCPDLGRSHFEEERGEGREEGGESLVCVWRDEWRVYVLIPLGSRSLELV